MSKPGVPDGEDSLAPEYCELCPRCCGVNRAAGETGWCRASCQPVVFRYGPHHGEEPVLSGINGSGTVFFSHCTMACCYCQNHPWSQECRGDVMTVAELAGVLAGLREAGCHNWNMVSPAPWLPWANAAVEAAAAGGRLPVVMNTGGYERVKTLERFAGLTDVFLADLRYADDRTAQLLSDAADYTATARSALRWMYEHAGALQVDDDGIARRGLICRVLIIPGYASEAVESLQWIRDSLGAGVAVSVMAQYMPAYRALESAPPLNRRISYGEYERVAAAVERLDFDIGWMQEFEGETVESLIGYKMPAGSSTAGC